MIRHWKYYILTAVVLILSLIALTLSFSSSQAGAGEEDAFLPFIRLSRIIEPYADAPKCDDSLHDDRAWHGLWNEEQGCHYDHEHHANPRDLDNVFGTRFYSWAGGEISYPWQTFSGAGYNFETQQGLGTTENELKHEGYRWMGKQNIDCTDNMRFLPGSNCVTAYRVQYHGIMSAVGGATIWHSMFVEANAISAITGQEGYFAGGGWIDFGLLEAPRGEFVHVDGEHPDLMFKGAEVRPYKLHCGLSDRLGCLTSWNSDGNYYNLQPGMMRMQRGFGVHIQDAWGPTDPNDPYAPLFYCPDFQCEDNDSEATIFRIWISIPNDMDGSQYDSDPMRGHVTYQGYTNRYGDIVDGCTAVGLDCVPLVLEHFPVRTTTHQGQIDRDSVDFDTSPEGVYWIEHPGHDSGAHSD